LEVQPQNALPASVSHKAERKQWVAEPARQQRCLKSIAREWRPYATKYVACCQYFTGARGLKHQNFRKNRLRTWCDKTASRAAAFSAPAQADNCAVQSVALADAEALRGPTNETLRIVESRFGEAATVWAEVGTGIEADPLALRSTQEIDSQVRIDEAVAL